MVTSISYWWRRHWVWDPFILVPILLLTLFGTLTINSIGADNSLALRHLIFTIIGLATMWFVHLIDLQTITSSRRVLLLYTACVLLLLLLVPFGDTINGARSWFDFGPLSLQPVDIMKVGLILVMAKYLSKRHVEIARFKHVLITGIYFVIPFLLVFLQPDFGSSVVLLAIWGGLLLMSGLTRRHIIILASSAVVLGIVAWIFVLAPYQKDRIIDFIEPGQDILGSGYNSFQSKITVGSGQLLGKGLGYGTQSRLEFLPEHETDFIFAAFAEEWGFVGAFIILLLYTILLWRLVSLSSRARNNTARLITLGAVWYLGTHIIINIGMNIGIFPVTGVTLPFMSYGGSHLLAEWSMIGLVMGIYRNYTTSYSQDIYAERNFTLT